MAQNLTKEELQERYDELSRLFEELDTNYLCSTIMPKFIFKELENLATMIETYLDDIDVMEE